MRFSPHKIRLNEMIEWNDWTKNWEKLKILIWVEGSKLGERVMSTRTRIRRVNLWQLTEIFKSFFVNCQRLTCWLSKIEEKNCELSKDCPILILMLMTHSPHLILHRWKWILYSQGRVWVHHLSSTKGYCWFSLADPVFCLFVCKWVVGKKPPLEWQLEVVATANCNSSSGCHWQLPFQQCPEFKLRWWIYTLPQLEKKYGW